MLLKIILSISIYDFYIKTWDYIYWKGILFWYFYDLFNNWLKQIQENYLEMEFVFIQDWFNIYIEISKRIFNPIY